MDLVGVVVPGPAARAEIAGRTVFDRATRLLERAGCARMLVGADALGSLPPHARVVVVSDDVVFGPEVLPRLLELASRSGATVAPATTGAILVDRARDAATPTVARTVDAGELHPASTRDERAHAERALFRATAKPTDGFLRRLVDRPLASVLARWLAPFPVSPSAVTVASLAVGLAGAAALALPSHAAHVAGGALIVLAKIGDTCDGTLARAKLVESENGDRLDTIADIALTLATFGAIGVDVVRGEDTVATRAAITALVGGGALACSAHELFRRLRPSGSLARVRRWMDRAALVDWGYAVLILALLDRLDLFVFGGAVAAVAFALAYVVVGTMALDRTTLARQPA